MRQSLFSSMAWLPPAEEESVSDQISSGVGFVEHIFVVQRRSSVLALRDVALAMGSLTLSKSLSSSERPSKAGKPFFRAGTENHPSNWHRQILNLSKRRLFRALKQAAAVKTLCRRVAVFLISRGFILLDT